ncbi:branched-chain amino acid ABC transporter permease [Paenarthrobacter sp. YJN-5]|uniref:branched-chain amino acid ABC transporter permease n=1 Tax=Paenarthrobacter sp. YJN-5 TaxID=2735316 RepID=UPI0018783C5A|nr:ABC transporter ATP-binding protein [Paenarthrobacter sp. YJN-5]QOT18448.1 ABC transporter ATP-binding protein [Paenarthrobacter sp. YJN-5]
MKTAQPAALRRAFTGRNQLISIVVMIAVLVILALAPAVVTNQYIIDVLLRVLLFAILALGLNIVVAQAGLLDLGYIAFWGVGAYTTALLSSPRLGLHLDFFVVTGLSAVAACIFAIIIGYPTLRLRGDYLAIVTLGFGEIVRISLNNLTDLTGGPSGIQAIDPPNIFGIKFGYDLTQYYYLAWVVLVLASVTATFLFKSRIGLSWTALRDDELAAKASGIKPLRMYLMAFGIGALFAGVSGSIFARVQGSVSPDSFVVDQSFMVLAIVVLAGLSRRIWPVIIAAAVIIALPEALREFQEYRMLVFGPLLVAAVVIRENAHRFKRPDRPSAVPADPDPNSAPQPADLVKEDTR